MGNETVRGQESNIRGLTAMTAIKTCISNNMPQYDSINFKLFYYLVSVTSVNIGRYLQRVVKRETNEITPKINL